MKAVAIRTVTDSVDRVDGPPDDVEALEAKLADLARRHPGAVFRRYLRLVPHVAADAHVAAGAVVVGDVRIESEASVWHGAVLRGDLHFVRIGRGSNVQDGAVVHVGDRDPAEIGASVVVGHGAVVHGCRIEDACLIGIRATILDGAVVGAGSIVGAGALVPSEAKIPPASLVLGVPGRVVRSLSGDDRPFVEALAAKYARLAHNHRHG
ncbi:MAG: gamma carbonic anhydrase family protein [Deltaproteobacteria bacterium]|nr:MAG: gamma carbonic anhydrase family protein [Deltaproteobacteria bacterium]